MMNPTVVLRPSCSRRLIGAVALMVLVLGAIAGVVRPDRRVAEAPAAVAIDNGGLVAGGPGQRQVWNETGQLVCSTDLYGRQTHFAYRYDPAGPMVRQTDPRGNVWHYEYGANNRLVATTDPTGRRREVARDPSTADEILADGRRTECRYDARGNLIAITDSQGAIRGPYTYQASDQLARITQFEYDALGRLTHRVDPKLPEGTTR